jgi:uncharacterized coiled-coil protein SlyX
MYKKIEKHIHNTQVSMHNRLAEIIEQVNQQNDFLEEINKKVHQDIPDTLKRFTDILDQLAG